MIPVELIPLATRFAFVADGLRYTIERYDNHGHLLPDGAWCVACWLTQGDVPNVHYLGNDGWKYKHGAAYPTLQDAWDAYCASEAPQ